MGSFANTVFSLLLGWLQAVTSMIWSALTAKNSETFLQFIGNNWIIIAVILCFVGLIADFIVYIFRWEPYKVWRSFWKKIRYGSRDETTTETDDREEIEAARPFQEENEYQEDYDDLIKWEENELPERNPVSMTEITKAGYHIPPDSPDKKPKDDTDPCPNMEGVSPENVPPRRRRRFTNFLGDSGGEEIHYFAPRPMVDQKEAYHAPVYPEKWNENRERDS